jgi:hypothetical protein
MMHKVKPMPGAITKTEEYNGEVIEITMPVMLWKCLECGKIYSREADAESCRNGQRN